ncbi:MAG: inositol-3-phosphate synthase [Erythrobacter sp.]|uniref:inositol-3-phosphate synthase n=1 Tax=Erythrobacter sp. TaxID=1042 RepID=UPI003266325F
MQSIRVAVVGVGNCASSLVQGVDYYRTNPSASGLIREIVGGYSVSDIEFVLGIDVDDRKVGKDLSEAIFAGPNNTTVFHPDIKPSGALVMRGPVMDGVADHMVGVGDRGFMLADREIAVSKAEIVSALREARTEILVNFLPVGSQKATEFYMECALEAGCAVVNCIPVFIASNDAWEARFKARGLPVVGDDIKAQVGATIVHRALSSLFAARGASIDRTYQLNTGGNTDFMNMLDRDRLSDKKESKTMAVQAALGKRLEDENILIGPSEYVAWQNDNKVCFLRVEGTQWGEVPMNLELRLSVEDSPNAAACVVDAIRFCKQALDCGESGALTLPSAYYCKHPPEQIPEDVANSLLDQYQTSLPEAAE